MTELDRRRLLRRTGAAITATGLGTVGSAGSVAASHNTSMILTRDHFDSECNLINGQTRTSFDTDGTVPCIDTSCVDELTVMVHGWRNDEQDAIDKTNECESALYSNPYDGDVVGFSWDSDVADSKSEWYQAECIARKNGAKLGNALQSLDSGGVDQLRVITHSLGVQVLFRALQWLYDSVYHVELASAHLLGAAHDDEAPTNESDWTMENFYALRYDTTVTFNYFSTNDDTVDNMIEDALGEKGHDWNYDVPCNFWEYNASSEVYDHSAYLDNLDAQIVEHMNDDPSIYTDC